MKKLLVILAVAAIALMSCGPKQVNEADACEADSTVCDTVVVDSVAVDSVVVAE